MLMEAHGSRYSGTRRNNFTCGICSGSAGKYKCPKCHLPYCSLACWKVHKSSECKSLVVNGHATPNKPKEYEHETEDTVPLERLQLLEGNEQLRNLLKDPHLRKILSYVDSAPDPDSAVRTAMQEPEFVEFVDRCLKIIEPPPDEKP